MTLHAELHALYSRLVAAFNASDFETAANCFNVPAVYAMPTQDVTVPDRAAMAELLKLARDTLAARGFDHTEFETLYARTVNDDMALMDAKNVRRLRADGTLVEETDGHYVARKVDGVWRISVAVTCKRGWEGD